MAWSVPLAIVGQKYTEFLSSLEFSLALSGGGHVEETKRSAEDEKKKRNTGAIPIFVRCLSTANAIFNHQSSKRAVVALSQVHTFRLVLKS